MPYTPQTWADGPEGGTPLSATRLNHMESGIEDADTRITGVESRSAQVEAIIKSGAAAVATNVLPPGLRTPQAMLVTEAHVRLGTAPAGSGLTVGFNRNGTQFATVTVPAASTSASATGLTTQFAAGDVLTWDITAVGSTTAGADVAAAVVGTLG